MTTRKSFLNPRWVILLLILLVPGSAYAGGDDLAELKKKIEALEAEIEAMKQKDEVADPLAELAEKVDILAAELEKIRLGEELVEADESEYGFGPAASKVYRTEQGLSIGGYGEMLLEAPDSEKDDGSASGKDNSFDFLRGIVYFGYKFNDRWLLNTEIEFEHASTGKSGEASVEFAYLDYVHRPELNFRTGLLLVPMGFINELHEPTVFLTAKRPEIERTIIPTTWRENGIGLFGEVGPVSYRTYVVNGLRADKFSSSGLRGGRQKGSKAISEDFAWVGRVDYTPAPGWTLGLSAYLGDSGQNLEDAQGSIGVSTTIVEGHAEWRHGGFQLRGLYAQAELGDVGRLNDALGLTGSSSVGESMSGYYLEAGYDVFSQRGGEAQLIPYVRFEDYNTQDEVPTGFSASASKDVEILTLGVAYKPIDELIFKFDFQDQDNGSGTGLDQFNLAVGYIF